MLIYDPLYGEVAVPEWLAPIVRSPEVQRLREIRLINTSCLSAPTLSDLRRFGHSIGAVALASTCVDHLMAAFGAEGYRTLIAGALLHDVGTAPFGHLFEYQLRARFGWSHSTALRALLAGTHHTLGAESQIYAGRRSALSECLGAAGIDLESLLAAVEGRGPLARVLSARLDVDNIDNVYRMALALGIPFPNQQPVQIAEAYVRYVGGDADYYELSSAVSQWQRLRSAVYHLLAFDPIALSSQAVLLDGIESALDARHLDHDDWIMTDDQLVRKLLSHDATYSVARRFQLAQGYEFISTLWYSQPSTVTGNEVSRRRRALSSALSHTLGFPVSIYAYDDNSALSRAVEVQMPEGDVVSIGESSRSTILSIFSKLESPLSRPKRRSAAKVAVELLNDLGLPQSALREPPLRPGSLFDAYGTGYADG